MNPIKSFLALTAILCVSTLYAEDKKGSIRSGTPTLIRINTRSAGY